jgi:RNA polymerase sigma-70 factor, ECF subfamily
MGQLRDAGESFDGRKIELDPASEQRTAFVRLAGDHLDAAYRLARAILRDGREAEDATHDAFEQAWRKWPTLRDPDVIERWFDRILVNTCRNRLRQMSRRQTKDISAEMALSSADEFDRSNDRTLIASAIASLSPDHAIVITLRYHLDLTVDEIAHRLDIPPGTVQSRLHYALKRLHAAIDVADPKGTVR